MRLIDADALADYFDALVGWSIPISDVVNVIENWPDHRRGRVACPLCDGKGTVEGKAPVISNEKDAFDAGFRLGLRAGAPGIKREDDR